MANAGDLGIPDRIGETLTPNLLEKPTWSSRRLTPVSTDSETIVVRRACRF